MQKNPAPPEPNVRMKHRNRPIEKIQNYVGAIEESGISYNLNGRRIKYTPAKYIFNKIKTCRYIERGRREILRKKTTNTWKICAIQNRRNDRKFTEDTKTLTDAAERHDMKPNWAYRKNYAVHKQKSTRQ